MIFNCNNCKKKFDHEESMIVLCPICNEQYGTKRKLEFHEIYDKSGLGITITTPGIGDGVQFTSLFENFYKKYQVKLIDVSRQWYLDTNPYVRRDVQASHVMELWPLSINYKKCCPRDVYLSNAEIHASVFDIKHPTLIRPRLYRFEDFPFEDKQQILFHPFGRSHGALPKYVIDQVIKKYKPTGRLFQIGGPNDPDLGIPKIKTFTLWNLAELISRSQMLIGVDSGPAWIAACYPDVITKKIRTKFQFDYAPPQDWVPMDKNNFHSCWDDRAFQTYNCTENDMGFTYSYLKI